MVSPAPLAGKASAGSVGAPRLLAVARPRRTESNDAMTGPREEFALLLAAPHPVRAELARNVLQEAGIPALLHGQDRDFAELGAQVHMALARPDLYVPKAALERARAVLTAVFGPNEEWAPDGG